MVMPGDSDGDNETCRLLVQVSLQAPTCVHGHMIVMGSIILPLGLSLQIVRLEQCSYPASQGERLPEKGVCREARRGGGAERHILAGAVRVLDSARTKAAVTELLNI